MAPASINANTILTPAIKSWRIYLEDQGRSIYTIKAFMSDMNLLASYLPADRTLGSISTKELNNYLDWMQHERDVPCSPKTLSRRITTLKSFFKWLKEHDVLLVDPAEKVVQKTVRSPLPEVLSAEEVELALDKANSYRTSEKPDARPYTLFKLLLDTGMKKGELLSLTAKHLDFDAPEGPIVFIRYANPNNRYKERKIPLTAEWIEAYDEYVTQYDTDEKLFPWSPRRLEYILEDLGKDANIQRISFHISRWTATLMDFNSDVEPMKIRQKLGISKIQWREVKQKLLRLQKNEIDVTTKPAEKVESPTEEPDEETISEEN